MADLKKLVGGSLAIVILAAIVLMGIAVVEGFSKEFRDVTGTVNMTMTTGAINVSTRIGTSEQYPYAQTVTQCENSSGSVLTGTNMTFDESDSTLDGGFLTVLDEGSEFTANSMECLGTYLADSTLQGHADKFKTGLAIFGTFIGVLILAVLGMFILQLFKKKKD